VNAADIVCGIRRGLFLIAFCVLAGGSSLHAAESVENHLGRQPWYDSQADSWQRVVPQERSSEADLTDSGDTSPFAFAMYALVIALVALVLAMVWKIRAGKAPLLNPRRAAGVQAAVAALPFAVPEAGGEPEHEYAAACARQDWARAVIWLFAWQLRSLETVGRIHLVQGKTNRHYLAEVAADAVVADALAATILAFERSYFGRDLPTAALMRDLDARNKVLLSAVHT